METALWEMVIVGLGSRDQPNQWDLIKLVRSVGHFDLPKYVLNGPNKRQSILTFKAKIIIGQLVKIQVLTS